MKRTALLAATLFACTSSNPSTDGGTDAASDAGILPLDIGRACEDWPAMIYEAPDATFTSAKNGDVLKCAKDNPIAMADLEKAARDDGYKGRPFTSGAKTFKIMYRTERGDPAKTAGYSSAWVLLPDVPRARFVVSTPLIRKRLSAPLAPSI